MELKMDERMVHNFAGEKWGMMALSTRHESSPVFVRLRMMSSMCVHVGMSWWDRTWSERKAKEKMSFLHFIQCIWSHAQVLNRDKVIKGNRSRTSRLSWSCLWSGRSYVKIGQQKPSQLSRPLSCWIRDMDWSINWINDPLMKNFIALIVIIIFDRSGISRNKTKIKDKQNPTTHLRPKKRTLKHGVSQLCLNPFVGSIDRCLGLDVCCFR